ncbi:MAG TPA: asparagine synthase (glutamine-hydrolyzing) [Candidatus Binatia bacterium]|nr:asparagine synthase (glutamine-hydrolyzing) [Candidatus Binatia bacterium]
MCGIVGFLGLPGAADDFPPKLERMLEAIRHRGPDEFGYYFDQHAGLGTARLAIIDLAMGKQPMADASGRHWLVFNGEIYNYVELRERLVAEGCRFETSSDTEVLLQALLRWGEKALPLIDGQFAFVLYDRRERRALAARDPYGERPLHYAAVDGGVAFASEIKALFTLPEVTRALDERTVRHAFHFWTVLPGETCFAGIRSLPPGHYARIDAEGVRLAPYYRLPTARSAATMSLDEAAEGVRALLVASVRRRLRSDVPVGTYLSGGVDSTIITYLAQQESRHRVQSFSVAFTEREYDESVYQKLAAETLGTDHHPLMTSLRDIAAGFPDAVWHAETVLFRTAPVPLLLLAASVHAAGFKVILTGEGSDEAFLGYEIFKETLFRERYHDFPDDTARLARLARLYPYLAHFQDARARSLLGFYARYARAEQPSLFSHETRFQNGLFGLRLLRGGYDEKREAAALAERLETAYPGFAALPSLVRAQVLEYDTLLAGYLLCSQGDRMAAAHSVETRCPFLETNLVDFAFRLPQDYRLRDGIEEKFVLRKAFADVLPHALVERQKNPFRAPDAKALLAEPPAEWLQGILERGFRACPLIDEAAARQLLARVRGRGAAGLGPREDQACVLVLSLALLHERFVERFPAITPRLGERLLRRVDGRTLARALSPSSRPPRSRAAP